MLKTNKWNAVKALLYGVCYGIGLIAFKDFQGDDIGRGFTEIGARYIGGAIGGAALFGFVAVIRNFFVK